MKIKMKIKLQYLLFAQVNKFLSMNSKNTPQVDVGRVSVSYFDYSWLAKDYYVKNLDSEFPYDTEIYIDVMTDVKCNDCGGRYGTFFFWSKNKSHWKCGCCATYTARKMTEKELSNSIKKISL
jgi:hypothetical protein